MLSACDRSRLLREVTRAGSCRHPIRLVGQSTNLATGEWVERELIVACKDRRSRVCPACSERYETDAWIIAAAGVNGGKGVPDSVAGEPRLFVTVTAPSFGSVHTRGSNGACVRRRARSPKTCQHGVPTWCDHLHEDGDRVLGHPLCPSCFDAEGAVRWNAHSTWLWSEMIRRARQNIVNELGTSRRRAARSLRLEYVKVVELQHRGLIHFHALIRLDAPDLRRPPSSAGLARAVRRAIRTTRVGDETGNYQFGSIADVRDLGASEGDVKGAATYLAKYVTKTAGGTLELARRFRDRRSITVAVRDEHLQRLALIAWDLGLHRHANTVGYSGQFLTKSRGYSTTFTKLRAARAAYWNAAHDPDPCDVRYRFDGRGYDDPRAAELADVIAQLDRERRRDERRRAKEKDDHH